VNANTIEVSLDAADLEGKTFQFTLVEPSKAVSTPITVTLKN
jgi:hypothetical protein